MAGTIAPFVFWQCLDDNGEPLDGALVFTYAAGTSTKQTTYSNQTLTTPNTNPIVLDSAGRAQIWCGPGLFKFVLAPANDTDPPTSPIETRDGVSAVPTAQAAIDVSGIVGEDVTENQCLYLSSGSGSKTAGYWYKAKADLAYSSTTAAAIGFATATAVAGLSINVRTLGTLDGFAGLGSGVLYYISGATAGAITATAPTNAKPVAVADSATSIVIAAPVPIVFAAGPKRAVGTIVAPCPAILQHGYSGGSAMTTQLSIPANTLAVDGDSIVCEWVTDYSSATLSSRLTVDSVNTDTTTGGNTTVSHTRAVLTRTATTTLRCDISGQQSAAAMTSTGTITVLDMGANVFVVSMGMSSGTYTIRHYSVALWPKT